MRVIFMGTPDFAVPALSEILGQGHEVAAVYTRAPKPAGRRGLDLTPSPVHRLAAQFGVETRTPRTLRDPAEQAAFAALAADVAVVVAYGLILPAPVLEAPALGCLNLHASLLPRWRGAAPIHRAVMAGDAETGVMVMKMEEGLDTGPVAMAERLRIGPDETTGELHDRLAGVGADLLARALAALSRGALRFTPQSETGVLYAHKIDKAEARVDWAAPAREVHDRIRGLSPFPGAFFEADFGKGLERVKLLRATLAVGQGRPGELLNSSGLVACGAGAVRLAQVQRAGRGGTSFAEFARGARLEPGRSLKSAGAGMTRAVDFAEIRAEAAGDAPAVRALLREAFAGCVEADLVEALRRDGDLALGLVAVAQEGLAGYVGFSRALVAGRPALALAPLAVGKGRRLEGVGARLVRAGLRALEESFVGHVVVLGDPIWYERFGFRPAPGLACRWSGPHLMALPLGAAGAAQGALVHAPAFDAL